MVFIGEGTQVPLDPQPEILHTLNLIFKLPKKDYMVKQMPNKEMVCGKVPYLMKMPKNTQQINNQ